MRSLRSSCTLAIVLATTVAGCSPLYFDWDSRTFRSGPPEPAAAPAPITTRTVPTQRQSASIPSHTRKPTRAPEIEKTEPEQGTPTPPAATPPAESTLSMASAGNTSDTVAKAIDSTSQRLARYDRSQLNGTPLAMFEAANGFLNQGKQALADKDYVAASGFAHKASVLADKLQASVTPR